MAGYLWGRERKWLALGSAGLGKGIFESKILLVLWEGFRLGNQHLQGAPGPFCLRSLSFLWAL